MKSRPCILRRASFWVGALAVLLAVLFFSATWQTGDDARYYGLALSLVRGLGYTAAYLPQMPPETITPPGHPLMLWLVMKVFGATMWPGRIMGVLFFVGATLLVYAWVKRQQEGDELRAFGVACAGMFSVYTLAMSCWFMAEMTYLFFSFLALVLWSRADRDAAPSRFLLLGAVAGYAYLVRSVGLALLAAAAMDLLIRRRWRALALFLVAAAVVVLPWSIRNYVVASAPDVTMALFSRMAGGSGAHYPALRIFHDIAVAFPQYFVTDLPRVMFYNVFDGRELLPRVLSPAGAAAVKWIFLGFVTAGFLSRLRRPGLAEFYWVLYWLLISAPPFPPQGHWYVIPMLPLAALYAADSGTRLARLVSSRAALQRGPASALGVIVLALGLLGGAAHFIKERPKWGLAPWDPQRYRLMKNEYEDAWASYVEAAQWVASNMPPDTVVVARKPEHVWIITGHQGWRYDSPDVPGSNLLERLNLMAAQRPTVVIEDAFPKYEGATFSYGASRAALSQFLRSEPEHFERLYDSTAPTSHVWRFGF